MLPTTDTLQIYKHIHSEGTVEETQAIFKATLVSTTQLDLSVWASTNSDSFC